MKYIYYRVAVIGKAQNYTIAKVSDAVRLQHQRRGYHARTEDSSVVSRDGGLSSKRRMGSAEAHVETV